MVYSVFGFIDSNSFNNPAIQKYATYNVQKILATIEGFIYILQKGNIFPFKCDQIKSTAKYLYFHKTQLLSITLKGTEGKNVW